MIGPRRLSEPALWRGLALLSSAETGESFQDFKNSFSYGTRTDLTFKFLKGLSEPDAAEAIRQLLRATAESLDHGRVDRLHSLILEWQTKAYAPVPEIAPRHAFDDGPFTPMHKPLSESKVGLVSSSGHFVKGDDPRPLGQEDMTQAEAVHRIGDMLRETAVLSEIPVGVHRDDLRVRHGGFDIGSALEDHNVAFPRDALVAETESGRIGSVAETLYSFPGATSQARLKKYAIPQWVERFQDDEVDLMAMVPL